MPDREAKKKTEIKKSAVSAPVEIGKPKEGSEKDIRWYVIHTYSGYENAEYGENSAQRERAPNRIARIL